MKYAFTTPEGILVRVEEFFDTGGEHCDSLAKAAADSEGLLSTPLPRYRFYRTENLDRTGAGNLLQEAQYMDDAAALAAANGQAEIGGYGCLVEVQDAASWRALNPPLPPPPSGAEKPVEMPAIPPIG